MAKYSDWGQNKPAYVDIRIIACTNRDLRAAVRNREFREDLFFRLGAFEISIPPLASRREDLPLLIRHFLSRAEQELHKGILGLTPAAERLLLGYSWPGNVRELEQAIHFATVMARLPYVDTLDLPAHLRAVSHMSAISSFAPTSRCEAEDRHVLEVLCQTGGDKREAARILGVSRATLCRLLKRSRSDFGHLTRRVSPVAAPFRRYLTWKTT